SMEDAILTKTGEQIPHHFTGARLETNGKAYLVGMAMDITERKRAQEEVLHLERQIQHAQKLESLGVLAGGIAHDFNNLLMAVLGNAELAMAHISPVSPAKDNIEEISKASQRAAELAKQMLAYSGKGRFVVEAVDLSELVQEMTHMLEVSVSKKAVLRYEFADNLPAVEADATQIRQVIMNLITNASDAIGDRSGVISIVTGLMDVERSYLHETYLDEDLPEGLYVTLEVADTGCGMDAETQDKLFDPFFTTKFTGRGLGMAAVLGIIRGHSGAIRVYSELGQGTTMKLLLPAAGPPVAATRGDAKKARWKGSGTVLLVDDEESVRAIGKAMLERLGMKVILAADGVEAVDIYREQADGIDCVILDLTMPRMNGEEAYRELRRIRDGVHVIMSSGYNQQDVTQRFVGKGLGGFIQKPYTLLSLATALQGALDEDGRPDTP
ncbi:MAG: response regulator, partial [Victivallales bacterium]|nr:response regulator [Victivallales bacterium]